MSFSFSLQLGFLTQTATYGHSGILRPEAALTTTTLSDNLAVKVYPRWFKHIAVEWSVPADWGNCVFNVYFSQVSGDDFEKINPAPISGTYLLDDNTQEYRKFNRGIYVVEAILLDRNNVAIRSEPTTWEFDRRRWVEIRSTEIQRREQILLSKFNGVKSYLFRRRTYGERCPECWSYTTEKVIKDHCTTCFGTSFKGGYFSPAPFYMNYDSTPNATVKSSAGVTEPNQIMSWTISLPEVRPDDVIVRTGDWSMYRVEGIAPTELQIVTVRQVVKLTQLAKSDIENQLLTINIPEYPDKYK